MFFRLIIVHRVYFLAACKLALTDPLTGDSLFGGVEMEEDILQEMRRELPLDSMTEQLKDVVRKSPRKQSGGRPNSNKQSDGKPPTRETTSKVALDETPSPPGKVVSRKRRTRSDIVPDSLRILSPDTDSGLVPTMPMANFQSQVVIPGWSRQQLNQDNPSPVIVGHRLAQSWRVWKKHHVSSYLVNLLRNQSSKKAGHLLFQRCQSLYHRARDIFFYKRPRPFWRR